MPHTATHCPLQLAWSTEHALWTLQQFTTDFHIESTRYHQENISEPQHFGGAGLLVWGRRGLFWVPELTNMFKLEP
ncbi:hypothetical protein TNCV_3693971 [Trichonephila clavipes]|nr:hypothetical protein TNCV_3693971 [Trichonephila clavipes]